MADQVVPITNLSQIGMNKDHPPVSLPPNAFTDSKNIRFRHGAVYKMSGEKIFERLSPDQLGVATGGEFVFITEWTNPNLEDSNTYYIAVIRENNTTDHIVLIRALPLNIVGSPDYHEVGTTTNLGRWQSTLFQGGFAIILNNGIDIPFYLIDTEGGTAFNAFTAKQLPGWDSYFSLESIIDVTYDAKQGTPGFSAGSLIDYTYYELIVEVYDTTDTLRGTITVTADGTYQHANHDALFVTTDTASNTTLLTPQYDNSNNTALLDGERFIVYKKSNAAINIRAGLVKSYGDFLIAGDLQIVNASGVITKQLPGMIRTSNIAAPGALPSSWNPYEIGSNTADEIQLASTGIVRDMVLLQNQMFIYTDRSIHSLQVTGNPTVPFAVSNVTDNYGALTSDSVVEFDGRHLVIGNNDIYLFGGHPGSIQSLAEDKVRDFFYGDLNSDYIYRLFIFRNISKDEIWINYPAGTSQQPNKTLIYNYKNQCWSVREMSIMRSGFAGRVSDFNSLDAGDAATTSFVVIEDGGDATYNVLSVLDGDDSVPNQFDASRRYPIFADDQHIYFGEADDAYTLHEGGTYESYIARTELPVSPEFDVEHMSSLALWTTRYGNEPIVLSVYAQTHDYPAGDNFKINKYQHEFIIGSDYKVDIRQTGRFFDYKITDKPTASSTGVAVPWSISGMQVKLGKRGER